MAQASQVPYLWAALAITAICACIAGISERSWIRALWINLAVLSCTLGAVEAYFWSKEPLERQMQYSEGFFVPDETLGYKPVAGQTLSHLTSIRNEPLYQVSYTINTDGLRVAASPGIDPSPTNPPSPSSAIPSRSEKACPTKGMMPYQVWKKLKGTYRTVNLGFLGYGPHQMLAALQHGHLESQGHYRPSHVVYQAISTHVSRAAGLEAWDPHGPRYVLNADGGVQQVGHFDDVPRTALLDRLRSLHRCFPVQLKTTLEQNALYRLFLRSHRAVGQQDVALFTGIVEEAKTFVERTYPGAQFHVLFWDFEDDLPIVDQVLQQLRNHNLAVYPMSTILPDFPADERRYEISPYDRHPNSMAHETIADFVAQSLVQKSP